ncbi:hypothetical protein B9Z55_003493 [Caenorhabditis nigoni]|uniref:Uncharacterized protein n=1 Tax=Caenorhabditis nigoni TaxID=1611254 RepID=A0A2G5VQY6_9PELO|nr:hypothetical protein B9Z55_003493 [Caenorhabditis nigoni]
MKTNVCVSPIPHYLSFLCFLFIFHRPNHFIIVSNWRNVSASSFFSSLYYFSEILYIFLNIPCASGDDKKSPIQSFWKKFNVKKCYILDISEIQISLNTPGDGKVLEIKRQFKKLRNRPANESDARILSSPWT